MLPLIIFGTVIVTAAAGLYWYYKPVREPVINKPHKSKRSSSEQPKIDVTLKRPSPVTSMPLHANPDKSPVPSALSEPGVKTEIDTGSIQPMPLFVNEEEGIYHHAKRISRQGWTDLDYVLVSLSNLPADALELLKVLNNPASSASHVAEICEQSVGLTARILKVVNSPFYGIRTRIDSVKLAVATLGFNEIRQVILTTSIFQRGECHGILNIDELWNHSIAVAHIATAIADKCKVPIRKDLAGTGSVLHDVGKLVLQRWRPEGFRKAVHVCCERDIPLAAEELLDLSLTHSLAGALLLDRWHLPPTLLKVVKGCHLPVVSSEMPEAALVYLAGQVARHMAIGADGEQLEEVIPSDVRSLLGIEDKTIPDMVNRDFEDFARNTLASISGTLPNS